jgi:hypothetical protein
LSRHCADDAKAEEDSGRLSRIKTILGYFLTEFRIVYKQKQYLAVSDGMIPWRGKLWFRTYNAAKRHMYV